MANNKTCPLSMANEREAIECLADKCAWWDVDAGCCGMVSQAFAASWRAATEERRADRKAAREQEDRWSVIGG